MLRIDNIRTYYGDSLILHGISFTVPANKCVALMGRNGVGKTTTLRSILGLTPPRDGAIWLNERRIDTLRTHEIVSLGLAYVPEDRGIFASLTTDEHLTLAQSVVGRWRAERTARSLPVSAFAAISRTVLGRPANNGALDRVYELFPNLAQRRKNFGNQLSGGEQQMLAIARALVLEPKILILDEPSEGLAPIIIEDLEHSLHKIKRSGTTILLVEQNYAMATSLADEVHVMSQGQIRFSGTSAELDDNDDVKALHLGI